MNAEIVVTDAKGQQRRFEADSFVIFDGALVLLDADGEDIFAIAAGCWATAERVEKAN